MAFKFLTRPLVETLQKMQIERFGGLAGLRDESGWNPLSGGRCTRRIVAATTLLNSPPPIFFCPARNHAFVDSNKRIAIVAVAVFLLENDYEIETTDANL